MGDVLRSRRGAAVVLPALLLAGCQGGELDEAREDPGGAEEAPEEPGPGTGSDEDEGQGEDEEGDGQAEEDVDGEQSGDEPEIDPAEVGANELGEIPVLMYHRILPDGGGAYDLTAEQFRSELEYLYEHDYRPVRTDQLVDGELDVPAGTTPVVLTFDDSTREQFGHTEDGEIDPDTAVGILREVAEEHDGFEAVGSFYVTGSLFGYSGERGAELLADLHELGFELGNHTFSHQRLDHVDADGVRRELALGAQHVREAVPEAEVRTLSLPLGQHPDDPTLLTEGSHEGIEYRHEGVLLVGSNPAPSPFHTGFEPLRIPRIRSLPPAHWDPHDEAGFMTSGYWFDVFEDSPQRRYVSDGDPERISFPEARADELDEAHTARANPY